MTSSFMNPARIGVFLAGIAGVLANPVTARAEVAATPPAVQARTAVANGVRVFYRVAGAEDKPVIVLLHGFPSSSHMFRELIPLLARDFRVIAPDYPGFGHSDMPSPAAFAYTFDNLAATIDALLEQLRVRKYILYMHDYGGPVGFRIAVRHPERVAGLVIQNANAYDEGLSPEVMQVLRPLWKQRTPETLAPVRGFLTPESTKLQYTAGAARPEALNPDAWVFDQALLDRPGNADIQLDLLADYGSNVTRYREWQAYFRRYQPRTLVAWGKGDPFFLAAGAEAYQRDIPDARLVFVDSGHFALEEHSRTIADEIRRTFGPDAASVNQK